MRLSPRSPAMAMLAVLAASGLGACGKSNAPAAPAAPTAAAPVDAGSLDAAPTPPPTAPSTVASTPPAADAAPAPGDAAPADAAPADAAPADAQPADAAPEEVAAPEPLPATPFHLGAPKKVDPNERSTDLATWLEALDRTPLVSADGSKLAYADVRDDGGRGYPNLHIELLDPASDKVVSDLEILTADEIDNDKPTAGGEEAFTQHLIALIRERVQKALAELGTTQWHPLAQLKAPEHQPEPWSGEAWGPFTADVGGKPLAVTFKEPTLTTKLDGKAVASASGKRDGFMGKRYPKCPTTGEPNGPCDCSNPAYLSEAWADAATKVLFVRIAYAGTDTCWEPDATEHAFHW